MGFEVEARGLDDEGAEPLLFGLDLAAFAARGASSSESLDWACGHQHCSQGRYLSRVLTPALSFDIADSESDSITVLRFAFLLFTGDPFVTFGFLLYHKVISDASDTA